MFRIRDHVRLMVLLGVVANGVCPAAQVQSDELWSEGGLRVSNKSLQLDLTGEQRPRVRLVAVKREITVEASTFIVMGANQSGIVVKSTGPATVEASDGRRMYADSIEVWLSADGWGYFKAVRRVIRQ